MRSMCFFRLLNLFKPTSALCALFISSLIPPLLRPELAPTPIFGVALFVLRKSPKSGAAGVKLVAEIFSFRWEDEGGLSLVRSITSAGASSSSSSSSASPASPVKSITPPRLPSSFSIRLLRSISLNSSLVADACFTKSNGVCLEEIDLCFSNNLSSRSNVNAGFPNPGLLDVAYAARLAFAALANVSNEFSSLLRNLNSSRSSSSSLEE